MIKTQGKNPKNRYPKPPFPPQSQGFPGIEAEMNPLPDYGKDSYHGCNKLAGKVALITGGDSGIGRAVALAFAREGADIAISYLSEHQDAERIANDIRDENRRVILLPGDITDESHCKMLVDEILDQLGSIDVLVNNAGYQQQYQRITEIPSKTFERIFQTNVYAMFYLCKYATPHMKHGTSIINTASIQAFHPSPTLLPYAATKGAIVTFTKALAQEVIQNGIRVNAVAPGPVWTPFIPASSSSESVSLFGKHSLFGRPAQPVELAPLYVFLASDEASFVTGEVYGATGSINNP